MHGTAKDKSEGMGRQKEKAESKASEIVRQGKRDGKNAMQGMERGK
jgi:hypothetical protein